VSQDINMGTVECSWVGALFNRYYDYFTVNYHNTCSSSLALLAVSAMAWARTWVSSISGKAKMSRFSPLTKIGAII